MFMPGLAFPFLNSYTTFQHNVIAIPGVSDQKKNIQTKCIVNIGPDSRLKGYLLSRVHGLHVLQP